MADDDASDDDGPGFVVAFDDDPSGRRIVIEDDGETVYAYVLVGGRIVGDVWLTNRQPAPTSADWRDPTSLPFAHKPALIDDAEAAGLPLRSPDQLSVRWDARGADVFIDDAHVARLEPGARPGWCRFVTADSPLARKLP